MGFLCGLLAILAGGAAEAQSDTDCAPVSGSGGTVADAVDGDTLILADGRVVRLAGIEAPKPFLARPGADVEALAERGPVRRCGVWRAAGP